MGFGFRNRILERARMFFVSGSSVISAINRKYATPRIRMTRGVALALLMLRLYLIFLVLLLAYKFWTMIQGS